VEEGCALDNAGRYLNLLHQKREIVQEIFDATQQTILGDTAESSVIYTDLIDRREEMLERLKAVQKLLEADRAAQTADGLSVEETGEAATLNAEVEEMIRQVILTDQQNEPKIQLSMNRIKENLKGLKTSRAISDRYQKNIGQEIQFFDRKK